VNKTLSALATSLLLISSPAAFAASSVDLTVKGLITPSACTPNLSSGGIIDHGKISAKDLKPDNPTLIGTHTLTMTVSCDAAIPFALHSIDNRDATTASGSYSLGMNNGKKLGWFSVMLSNPVADSIAVQPIASYDSGTTWYREKYWDSGLYMSVAAMDDDSQPLAVKDLTVDLIVESSIARTDGLDLSNEVTLDGSATFEVKYL
jgi:type 1 fimbria pilin